MFLYYKTARDYVKTSWYFIAFALAGLFFTLAPHVWQLGFISNLDIWIAERINGWIGISPAYDQFVRFLTSQAAQVSGALAILAICIIFAWRERFYDMGRFLGYLLWIGAGIIIALLLAYYLTERLEEQVDIHGPFYHLAQFKNINEIHDGWDIKVKDKTSVPSRYTTVYFSIFWLALFRSPLLSLALLVPALLLSPGHMLVGREWPSSVVAGIFWAGSVGALLARTPLAVIPRWMEENSMYLVERVLTIWTSSVPKKPTTDRALTRTVEIPEGPRVLIKDVPVVTRDHLADLIQVHILPLLDCVPGSEISISGLSPLDTTGEPLRHARFVTGGGLETGVVVKAAWKNPLNATQSQRFKERRNAANMHALLELRGASVPRLLFTQNTRRFFAPRRFFFTVEDLVPERSIEVGNVAECTAAAQALAQMHAIRRYEAGGLFGTQIPRDRYPHRATLPRVRKAYGTIIQEMPGAEISFFGQHAFNWFWEHAADLVESNTLFSLCHGSLRPDHTRMTDQGAMLIGFARSSFDFAGFDIVHAMIQWGGKNVEAMAAIVETLTHKEADWLQFQNHFELFVTLNLFEMANEQLKMAEEKRDQNSIHRITDQAAWIMRGKADKPSSPTEAAQLLHQILGG